MRCTNTQRRRCDLDGERSRRWAVFHLVENFFPGYQETFCCSKLTLSAQGRCSKLRSKTDSPDDLGAVDSTVLFSAVLAALERRMGLARHSAPERPGTLHRRRYRQKGWFASLKRPEVARRGRHAIEISFTGDHEIRKQRSLSRDFFYVLNTFTSNQVLIYVCPPNARVAY